MHTKRVMLGGIIVLLYVLFISFLAIAEENLTLKDVMQGLNADLQAVTYGIIMDNYELIATSAQAIAEHPTPDAAILKKIVTHLGAEMPNFKSFDQQVHDTALGLQKAALDQDKEALLRYYNEIIVGCVGCHQSYRKSVSDLFDN